MKTEDILVERGKTHGHFPDHAAVTQAIKRVLYYPKAQVKGLSANTETETITRYDAVQREGLDMIAHKLGRIVAGDHTEPDHWADIAGYARLVADHLERGMEKKAPAGENFLHRPGEGVVRDLSNIPVRPCPECGAQEGEFHSPTCPTQHVELSQPAPPAMRDVPMRTCKACGAPSGTHYGACPLKPNPAPL